MGALFALFAAFYFWAPKIVGKTFNEEELTSGLCSLELT